MKKLILSAILILFLVGNSLVFAAGSQSVSFTGSPSSGAFTGANHGGQMSISSSFNASSIPSSADIQSASITVSQANTAQVSGETFSLKDKATNANLGTKTLTLSPAQHSFGGLAELINTWVTSPSQNQGVIFTANTLDPEDNISITSITLSVTYYVEDNTAPVISGVKTSSVGGTSVKITWSTNEDSLGFVDYGKTTGYGLAVAGSDYIKTHTVSIIGLEPGTTYHYRIRAKDSSGNESLSGDFTFKTTGEVVETPGEGNSGSENEDETLIPPENLQYSVEKKEGDGFIVILSWDKSLSENIDGYRVYRAVDERYPIEMYIQLDDDILTFTDENVEKDKTYFYVIKAYKGEEESSESNEQRVKVTDVTTVSQVPIQAVTGNFWVNLIIVNVAGIAIIAGVYFLINKLSTGKKKELKGKTPETLINLQEVAKN